MRICDDVEIRVQRQPRRIGFLTGPAWASQYRADARDRNPTRPGGRGSDSVTRRSRPAKSRRPRAETTPGGGASRRRPSRGPPPPAPPATLWRWLVPLACALVTLVVFLPVLGNQFVDWDDEINFVNNPAYRGLGWAHPPLDVHDDADGALDPADVDHVRRATIVLWGMRPLGYHLTSLLLHAAAAGAVYFVAAPPARAATRWSRGEAGCLARRAGRRALLRDPPAPRRVGRMGHRAPRRPLRVSASALTVLSYLISREEGARRRAVAVELGGRLRPRGDLEGDRR